MLTMDSGVCENSALALLNLQPYLFEISSVFFSYISSISSIIYYDHRVDKLYIWDVSGSEDWK